MLQLRQARFDGTGDRAVTGSVDSPEVYCSEGRVFMASTVP
mgnify:CR=1 FL=1